MKVSRIFETSFGDRFEKKPGLSYKTFVVEFNINKNAWFWALNIHKLGAGPTAAATGNLLRPVFNLDKFSFVRDAHYSYSPSSNKISIKVQLVQKRELASTDFFQKLEEAIKAHIFKTISDSKMENK